MVSPSPSQRAALHAATLRARSNRKSQTPGPGAYETPRGISSKGGAGAAFKSASKRGARDEEVQGDPGAYDPYGEDAMGSRSARSYSRSSCAGAGSFGSLSARTLQRQAAGVDTPGPGSYAQQAGLFDRARTSRPSSALHLEQTDALALELGSLSETISFGFPLFALCVGLLL